MNWNIRLWHYAFCLLLLFDTSTAMAGETSLHNDPLPDYGSIQFQIPSYCEDQLDQTPDCLPLTIKYTKITGSPFAMFITPIWPANENIILPDRDYLRKSVQESTDQTSSQAVENTIVLNKLTGSSAYGYYYSGTDQAPKPEEYKYLTQGHDRVTTSFGLKDVPAFLGGALAGLVFHEAGHYAMDLALGTDPYIKSVNTSGIPFFAVTYRKAVTPRQEYAIASAGFLVQYSMAEVILAKYPHVWQEAPTAVKGAFAFHLVTSLIYAYGALAKSGPSERDTLGMANGLDISERWVGLAVLIPAALDLYRSFYPNATWATWTSRGVKIGFVFALTQCEN
jgi:hypothetical protein